jgi:glucose-1-phosphate thymidylyltransferase
MIQNLQPSPRGEYEITDVSRCFLECGELTASVLQNEWIDAGTFESLFEAAALVRAERKVQNL